MFTNLIFLITVLLLISLMPESALFEWPISSSDSLVLSISGYLLTLISIFFITIIFQLKPNKAKGFLTIVVNLLLITYFIISLYLLGVQRAIPEHSPTLTSIIALLLYFIGIGLFHYFYQKKVLFPLQNDRKTAWEYAVKQLKMIVPFAIPFLILTLFIDIYDSITINEAGDAVSTEEIWINEIALTFISLTFIVGMMALLPPVIIRIWQCKPLPDSPLKEKLDALCQKANFKHAGMKTWTILNQSLTAAIIGIFPRFRYVIFTERLLKELPPEPIEAILAHEIGHSYHKHMTRYPLILFGALIVMSLFTVLFFDGIENTFTLANKQTPSLYWNLANGIIFFLCYALIFVIYFRFVFGYFSRIFERQADLHAFHLDIPADAMIQALDEVAIGAGYIHHHPSWHHYSIAQRIDFLKQVQNNPSLITAHHRKVRYSFVAYLIILGVVIGSLFYF